MGAVGTTEQWAPALQSRPVDHQTLGGARVQQMTTAPPLT